MNEKNKLKIMNIALATGFISNIPYNVLAVDNENLLKVEWNKSFGEGGFENFESVAKTSDGGYVVVGEADLNENMGYARGDAVIVKYDKDGNQVWFNAVIGNDTELFYSVIESKDGGFYAVGKSFSSDLDFANDDNYSNAIIVKYDKEGKELWIKAIHDNGKNINYKKIIETSDNKLVVVGDKISGGKRTAFFSYVDENGNILSEVVSDIADYTINVNDAIETKNKEIAIVGMATKTSSTTKEEYPIVLKIPQGSTSHWHYIIKDDEKDVLNVLNGEFTSLAESSDGDLIVAGYTKNNNDDKDAIIMSFDKGGKQKWWNVVRGEEYDSYSSVMINSKKEILVVGENMAKKDSNPLTEANVNIARYKLTGEKIRMDNVSDTIKNVSEVKGILTEDDKAIIIGKSFKKVAGALAKCDVLTADIYDECIEPDGAIMKVSIITKEVLPAEDENKPCDVNEKPVIKAEDVTIYVGETFKPMLNVSATDKESGDLTNKITVSGSVDSNKAGEYKVVYKVTDECGASAEKEIKVTVKEKQVPSGNTQKPQTGDEGLAYMGITAVSALGLVSLNKRKEEN